MKKLLFVLLIIPIFSWGQSVRNIEIDSYKYIVMDEIIGKHSGEMRRFFVKNLKKAGYTVVNTKKPLKNYDSFPQDLIDNPNLALYLVAEEVNNMCVLITTSLLDSAGNIKLVRKGTSCMLLSSAIKKSISGLTSYSYKYNPDFRKKKIKKDNSYSNLKLPSSFDEAVIRDFLDTKKDLEPLEGLYRYVSKDSRIQSQYKFLILKEDFNYFGFIVEANCVGCENWVIGDVKFKMTEGAVSEILDVTWKYPSQQRRREDKIIMTSKVGGNLLESSNFSLLKLYPKANPSIKRKTPKNGEWAGNGSGVIISKSGHIITNYHVIEDSEDIEVEFMLNNELQKFNAEIVQVDKTNDLAVLKIFDMNFDGVSKPPYNFKFRGSDVGTKVYAYGYPMALSIMGKEVKVTDGIISSKSGFDGDITTYQITAPIQGGNSGGPLFDQEANLIGINSSGLKKEIADNVAYSIKTSYVSNLIDVLPKSIELPSTTGLKSLPLTEQIKEISKYVVLIKVK
jgi:S1-C subfamily serine protease